MSGPQLPSTVSVLVSVEGRSLGITTDGRLALYGNYLPPPCAGLPKVPTTVSATGNKTLTAAMIASRFIQRTGMTANATDTTDSAANIIAAVQGQIQEEGSGWNVGETFELTYQNNNNYQVTLAGGTGVTISGQTLLPPNSIARLNVAMTTATTVTITVEFVVTAPSLEPMVSGSLSTAGAGTVTAAMLYGRLIVRSGNPGAAFADTLDTAANIVAAVPNASVGTSFLVWFSNTTAFKDTITGNGSVTVSGNPIVQPGGFAVGLLTLTAIGTPAATFQVLVNGISVNANGDLPSTVTEQFGSSTATMLEEGNINRQVSASGSGVSPGATGADNVLAVYTIPANAFDVSGRGVTITAQGSFGATGNNKRIKIIFNPASAVVGSTVGASGTTIADTGTVATNGGGWSLQGSVFKYGAAGSNTQLGLHQQAQVGGAVSALLAPANITATESGAILVAVTGNATTATSDIVLNFIEVNAMN